MTIKSILATVLLSVTAMTAMTAVANEYTTSTTGVAGYDLVSYQTMKRPIRGNGHYLSVSNGVTYLFATEDNKNAFDANPAKYLPAYGGFCAFGASVGKKFVGDPEVWRLVDGTLYLNLDENIQHEWLKDVPGRIKTADANWKNIRNKAPSSL